MVGADDADGLQLMKSIGIICFTDYTSEPRVLRTIEALKAKYSITLYSAGKTIDGIMCIDISHLNEDNSEISFHHRFPLFARRIVAFALKLCGYAFQSDAYYKRQYWSPQRKEALKRVKAGGHDLVIGHGIETLPILDALNAKTVFNAHEYYPKEFEENTNWKKYTQPYYEYLLRSFLPTTDLMFCVSEMIQREYQKHYRIRSVEVTNATVYHHLRPGSVSDPVKIIHHGGAIRTRQLELMADMMEHLPPNYSLTFMLTPSDQDYLNELKQKYGPRPNIRFMDPVPVQQIAPTCNQFDIGVFILPPVNFNWYYALPNKLFEYIQGRLCIAVSPNPDMKRMVEEYKLGVVSDDYSARSMALAISALDANQVSAHKLAADACAAKINAGKTCEIILNEVQKLIG